MEKIYLSEEFLNKFDDFPAHMSAISKFTYLRTYSRYLPEINRRETWKETVKRATEYNINLAVKHLENLGYPIPVEELKKEAELLFSNMFNLKQFLSGRTLWVGDSDESSVSSKYPLSNFNCAFIEIKTWEDLGDLFYLLLVGTGVGFRATIEKMKNEMPAIRDNFTIENIPFEGLYPIVKEDKTSVVINDDTATIFIGDSKEGWVDSLREFFKILTEKDKENITKIRLNYNYIRQRGERLNTFGGTASGHESLRDMFEGIYKVLHNQIDPTLEPLERLDEKYVRVRPIHILDIGNLIGNNVVVGGVRRAAEIFLMDDNDWESIFAKYGINGFFKEEQFKKHEELLEFLKENEIPYPKRIESYGIRNYDAEVNKDYTTGEANREEDGELSPYNFGSGFYHRAMSNNSIAFEKKPKREFLHALFKIMQFEGEPGFVNMEEASRRRPNARGLNPCVEIILDSYGVCNLTTISITQFVKDNKLDVEGLLEAQKLSVRNGLRMTLVDLELPHWDKVQKRDRLLGVSMTGLKDAMDMLNYTEKQEQELIKLLGDTARDEANRYAHELRVNAPLLTTAVKPEGTLSIVSNATSSGLHHSHAPYYVRRIRINKDDPLAKAVLNHYGWVVNAENGTPGDTWEEQIKNAKVLVIDFPVKSGAKKTKEDISVEEQFKTYFSFQGKYTDHNTSNTITVKPHEWDTAEEIVYKNWDNFVGVSFLAEDGGTYKLAPYESITEEEYNNRVKAMVSFDEEQLRKYDRGEDFELGESCASGVCPIR